MILRNLRQRNERDGTPVLFEVGQQSSQRLSQWHPHHQRGCTSERDSHSGKSKVVPVHPGNQEKSSDPGTRSCHTPGRAHNRVSRLASPPGRAFDARNIAGFQAYSW
eukprot:4171677-Amphidinium_carterae.2